jgi:hypothetical protein
LLRCDIIYGLTAPSRKPHDLPQFGAYGVLEGVVSGETAFLGAEVIPGRAWAISHEDIIEHVVSSHKLYHLA